MWPFEPDDFESLVQTPADHQRDEAWFFVMIDGQLVCVSEQGIPRPVTGDELRWMDIEIDAEHYLGRYRGRCGHRRLASPPVIAL